MTVDILRQRLQNQLLTQSTLTQPSQVIAWLGAMQSQDYAGAKWAISQRTQGLRDEEIERSFANGEILRTHILRPTWHFVRPEDIRWMLLLTAPRVLLLLAYLDRQLGIEKTLLKKTNSILTKALTGGKQSTRAELETVLQRAGIQTDGLRLTHIVMHAELDGVLCSGARKGKQFTYALLEERAPQAQTLSRDEALVELTRRYFTSHGPATLKDFVWWSGLTMKEARKGIDFVASQFEQETIGSQMYWFASSPSSKKSSSNVFLLPNYDEYMVGYSDRTAIFDTTYTDRLPRESTLAQSILIDGRMAGLWKRTIKRNEVVVELAPFALIAEKEHEAVVAAAHRYGEFLGLPVKLSDPTKRQT